MLTSVRGNDMPARLSLGLATITTGLAAGFFYAYTVSVTRGLELVEDKTYVETMQAINATVRNAPFAFSFFGALLMLTLAVILRIRRRQATTWLVGAALALYLAAFLVTMLINVPLNEEFESVQLASPELAQLRDEYEDDWNRWNLVRTLLSIASFASLIVALIVDRRHRPEPFTPSR